MADWYARPVLFVTDMQRSLAFYLGKLGFREPWRYEEEGQPRVVQVDRQGCELILSSQWPAKAGTGLMFVSLDPDVFEALRGELAASGVEAQERRWGYRILAVGDPDGNQLYFPWPDGAEGLAPAA